MCRHQLSSFKEVCVFTHSERESIQLKIQVLKSLLHQLLEVNLITLNPVLQALAAHFQQLRGFGHVAAAGPKDFADCLPLHILHMTVQGDLLCWSAFFRHLRGARERCPACRRRMLDRWHEDVFRREHRAVGGDNVHGVLNYMLELPHIAGPLVLLKQIQGVQMQVGDIFAQLFVELHDELLGQQGDVLPAAPAEAER